MAPHTEPEHYFSLADGRTLAYAHAGDFDSNEVMIFFHGVFGIGSISSLPPVFTERKVHYICPTLPGWGNSSVPPRSKPFHATICEDITALLAHLVPNTEGLRLYIAGGSYGTAIAQMLFGASYDDFPYGKYLVGVLLLAPFSPPHVHKDFAKNLTWQSYFGVGPPSRIIPGNLLLRLGAMGMKSKLSSPEKAAAFMHDFALKKMTTKERELYEAWMERKGMKEGDMEKQFGQNLYTSIGKTWEGFISVSDVLHSGWGGYDPTNLDADHAKVFVMVVVSSTDRDTLPLGEWLAKTLPNSYIRHEEGGHMAALYVMDDIFADFLTRA